jgi:hypothetical protein
MLNKSTADQSDDNLVLESYGDGYAWLRPEYVCPICRRTSINPPRDGRCIVCELLQRPDVNAPIPYVLTDRGRADIGGGA